MVKKMMRRAGKNYVCVKCGRTIKKGAEYYRGGSPTLKNGRKKQYLYCSECSPDREKNFQGSRTKKMYEYVKIKSRFNDELRHLLSSNSISEYYRTLKKKGFPILRYRYIGRGSAVGTKKDPNYPRRFIIYYIEGEEEEARRRIMQRYPMQRRYMQRIFNPLFPKRKNAKKRTEGGEK